MAAPPLRKACGRHGHTSSNRSAAQAAFRSRGKAIWTLGAASNPLPALGNFADAIVKNIERSIHLRFGDDERRRERQHIAHRGLEREAFLERAIHDGFGL